MAKVLRFCFFTLFIRPVLLVLFGLNVRNRAGLPREGPAVVIANHNSHLDTMVLISLFPARLLPSITPAAAADYFLKGRLMSWFSRHIVGITPIARTRGDPDADPLAPISRALEAGNIVIFFPEGSRGSPEEMAGFKSGIAILSERHPQVPIHPVFLHGLGKAMPKGEGMLVPFVLDVFVGAPVLWSGERASFLHLLETRLRVMKEESGAQPWL